MDKKQDYKLIASQEKDGKTILEFKRKIDTCDDKDRVLEVSTGKEKFILFTALRVETVV